MQHFRVEKSYYNIYKRIFKDRCTFHNLGPGCRQDGYPNRQEHGVVLKYRQPFCKRILLNGWCSEREANIYLIIQFAVREWVGWERGCGRERESCSEHCCSLHRARYNSLTEEAGHLRFRCGVHYVYTSTESRTPLPPRSTTSQPP